MSVLKFLNVASAYGGDFVELFTSHSVNTLVKELKVWFKFRLCVSSLMGLAPAATVRQTKYSKPRRIPLAMHPKPTMRNAPPMSLTPIFSVLGFAESPQVDESHFECKL